jgi:hypothetical protein
MVSKHSELMKRQALARYINARRKKEEAQKKAEDWRKAMVVAPMSDEDQISKEVRTCRK